MSTRLKSLAPDKRANRRLTITLSLVCVLVLMLAPALTHANPIDLDEVWLEDLFRIYAESSEPLDRGPFSDSPSPYRPEELGHPTTRQLQRTIARKLNAKKRAGEFDTLRWYRRFLGDMKGNERRKNQLVEQVDKRIESLTQTTTRIEELSDLWVEDLFKVYAGSSKRLDRGPFSEAPRQYDPGEFGNPDPEQVAFVLGRKLDWVADNRGDDTLRWYMRYLGRIDGDPARLAELEEMINDQINEEEDQELVVSGSPDSEDSDPLEECRTQLRREREASLRKHDIPPGWTLVFDMLRRASRKGNHMQWRRWQELNDEPTEGRALFAEVVKSARDEIRDEAIRAAFGEAVAKRFGAVIFVATSFYDLSKQWAWEGDGSASSFEEREDYRRLQVYNYLLWQMANQLEANKGPFANPGRRYLWLGVTSKRYGEWANGDEWTELQDRLCLECPILNMCSGPTIGPRDG